LLYTQLFLEDEALAFSFLDIVVPLSCERLTPTDVPRSE